MAAVQKLLNKPEKAVTEMLEGLVLCTSHLQRLDGFPDIKVVYDKTHDKSKVAIVAGGGSGHEPAHAGYVGHGMLTAAVAGEVFASPSADAVLAAIRTVTGPAGCLLVVKNYTGDRLHFGLAAEQAKAEGLKVEMVCVGEDVAIDNPGLAGRRGLAGTVFVHKLAGAAAARGASLEQVVAVAQRATEAMATMGVALRVCSLPGKPPSDRLGPNEIEIGLGIHGEPGALKSDAMDVNALVGRMLKNIVTSSFFGLEPAARVALMVNNLGSSTAMELYVVAKVAIEQLQQLQVKVERVYVGSFVTSLDMAGMSLTLLKLGSDNALLQLLDDKTSAPAFPAVPAVLNDSSAPTPCQGGDRAGSAASSSRAAQLTAEGQRLERTIKAAATSLLQAAPGINDLDSKVGDGDCGDTLASGAQRILDDLTRCYPLNDAAATMAQLALSVRSTVGGTSGALYEILLAAAARSLKESGAASARDYAAALQAGVMAVMKYGGGREGCRTMLDALGPAARAALAAAEKGGAAAAAAAASAAATGAEATKQMSASAGRSSYVPQEVLSSVPDPGAVGVSVWLKAVADSISQT